MTPLLLLNRIVAPRSRGAMGALGALLLAGLAGTHLLRATPTADWAARLCGRASTMFSTAMSPSGEAARAATVVKPLSCEPLPHVPGKSVTTALVEFAPGAYTGPHRHPGSVTAFVVSGAIRSQMAGAPAQTYRAGQVWFEPPRALHLFAENASMTEPATLLATFIADKDCGSLVIPEPAVQ